MSKYANKITEASSAIGFAIGVLEGCRTIVGAEAVGKAIERLSAVDLLSLEPALPDTSARDHKAESLLCEAMNCILCISSGTEIAKDAFALAERIEKHLRAAQTEKASPHE